MRDGGYAVSYKMHSELTKKQLIELCLARLKRINDLSYELRVLRSNNLEERVNNE